MAIGFITNPELVSTNTDQEDPFVSLDLSWEGGRAIQQQRPYLGFDSYRFFGV
jgi:hypothetical protein